MKAARCVVTGATSGIGLATAVALAKLGGELHLVGRDPDRLSAAARLVEAAGGHPLPWCVDLESDDEIETFARGVGKCHAEIDVLVHSAGLFHRCFVEDLSTDVLDRLYRVNLRAPVVLTRELLPRLGRDSHIVFLNSTASASSTPSVSAYSAVKAGLAAFTSALRKEVAGRGVRVTSVYPGRTATPMQQYVCELEGAEYVPERFMEASDVGEAIFHCVTAPLSCEVTDYYLRQRTKEAR